MDENENTIEDLKKIALEEYRKDWAFNAQKIDEIEKAYENFGSWQEFTEYCKNELNVGCPKKWVVCTDGSCAPPGGCLS